MYPHERSLVKKLENKPFVIIGVNSDTDRAMLKKTTDKEAITWRSFWDGGSTAGPIATRWNVQSWPTVYLLDTTGVIRYQRPVGADLKSVDAQVEKLLAELKPAAEK
jgi:hypothetical protein